MIAIAEQAAPAWLPIVLLLIPITIMTIGFTYGVRYRARARAVKRTNARRLPASAVRLDSAEELIDPSGLTPDALLIALATRPEHDGPTPDGLPWDEAYFAKMLGLKAKLSSGTGPYPEPHILWGAREQGQVFIRLGPDEKAEHSTPVTNRHFRDITVLRVAASEFEVRAQQGRVCASDGAPSRLIGLLEMLAEDDLIWGSLRMFAGPEGIVAVRPAADPLLMPWLYDLWLCERIARVLPLPPLPAARIGPAWKVPYGLGRSLSGPRQT